MSTKSGFPFHDCDRVVFLGCSITQSRGYTNHVECALLTRFPNLRLTFRNAGWGSDSAWMDRRAQDIDLNIEKFLKTKGEQQEAMLVQMVRHGLARDVLPLRPTIVFIMYGANDASYGVDAVLLHIRGLQEILAQLYRAESRVVLIGFTPQEPFDSAANIELKRYIEADHAFASRHGLPFVDLYHGCMDAIRHSQKSNPAYRFTSDAVHPLPHGHEMMATLILNGLGFEARKSELAGDPTPLMQKVIEKNNAYFRRWREIQIPAVLKKADVREELAEVDREIATLEAEIDALRANLNEQSARGTRP